MVSALVTSKLQWPTKLIASGLIYKDFREGSGPCPVDTQQVTFAYTGYNESGGLIDSTYRKGSNAQTQLGIKGLIPGMSTCFHIACAILLCSGAQCRPAQPMLLDRTAPDLLKSRMVGHALSPLSACMLRCRL